MSGFLFVLSLMIGAVTLALFVEAVKTVWHISFVLGAFYFLVMLFGAFFAVLFYIAAMGA